MSVPLPLTQQLITVINVELFNTNENKGKY